MCQKVSIFYSLRVIAESKSDTQKIQNPESVKKFLSKGQQALGSLQRQHPTGVTEGQSPSNAEDLSNFKEPKKALLEDRYKKITSIQAH